MFTHHVGGRGKLPRTLWRLFRFPGALSADYFAGIRARYIRPVRLYLIASVAFFVFGGMLTQHLATPIHLGQDVRIELDKGASGSGSDLDTRIAKRVQQWTQLPDDVRSRLLVRGVFDYAPKVMFMLLPLFALLTFLLYRNRRQQYAAHLVFALHYHAVVFFSALAAICVRWEPFIVVLALYALIYLPLALRHAFGGRIWVTMLRVTVLVAIQSLAQAFAMLFLLFAVLLF